jgi:hypothetical protein
MPLDESIRSERELEPETTTEPKAELEAQV